MATDASVPLNRHSRPAKQAAQLLVGDGDEVMGVGVDHDKADLVALWLYLEGREKRVESTNVHRMAR